MLVRAYLREVAAHLFLVLGGVAFLVVLGASVQASSRSQGAPIWIPLALVPLMVGNTLPYLVPVTLLVASVLTYGRMAADGEEQAVRSAGMHPLRLLAPALLAGAAVAAATYPLSASLLPRLYSAMRDLSFRLRFAALENTNPGASELHFQGMHLMWRGRDREGAFRDVVFFLRQDEGLSAFPFDPGAGPAAADGAASNTVQVRARRASMSLQGRELVLAFAGLHAFSAAGAGDAWRLRSDDTAYLRLDLDSLGRRPEEARKADDFTTGELRARLAGLRAAAAPSLGGLDDRAGERAERAVEKARRELGRCRYTIWRRLAVAVAALPLAAVGAMLGWRVRRAGVLPAFAAGTGLVLLLYYPLHYLGNALEAAGTLDAFWAAWLPVGGLLAAVAALWALPRNL